MMIMQLLLPQMILVIFGFLFRKRGRKWHKMNACTTPFLRSLWPGKRGAFIIEPGLTFWETVERKGIQILLQLKPHLEVLVAALFRFVCSALKPPDAITLNYPPLTPHPGLKSHIQQQPLTTIMHWQGSADRLRAHNRALPFLLLSVYHA